MRELQAWAAGRRCRRGHRRAELATTRRSAGGTARCGARWPHIDVSPGNQFESPENIAAAAAGLEYTTAGGVPNFSVVTPVLAGSDLLATLPGPAIADTVPVYDPARRVLFGTHP